MAAKRHHINRPECAWFRLGTDARSSAYHARLRRRRGPSLPGWPITDILHLQDALDEFAHSIRRLTSCDDSVGNLTYSLPILLRPFWYKYGKKRGHYYVRTDSRSARQLIRVCRFFHPSPNTLGEGDQSVRKHSPLDEASRPILEGPHSWICIERRARGGTGLSQSLAVNKLRKEGYIPRTFRELLLLVEAFPKIIRDSHGIQALRTTLELPEDLEQDYQCFK